MNNGMSTFNQFHRDVVDDLKNTTLSDSEVLSKLNEKLSEAMANTEFVDPVLSEQGRRKTLDH